MKLSIIRNSSINNSLYKQSLVKILALTVLILFPIFFFLMFNFNEIQKRKTLEKREALENIIKSALISKSKYGDLIYSRAQSLNLAKNLGLLDLGICVQDQDIFERPHETRCKGKHSLKSEVSISNATLDGQEYKLEFHWQKENQSFFQQTILAFILSFLIALLFILPLQVLLLNFILNKVKKIITHLIEDKIKTTTTPESELFKVPEEFKEISIFIDTKTEELKIATKDLATTDIAKQVSHDIKSPLAALNIISSHFRESLSKTPDIKRIFDNSILRINSIANDLSTDKKKSDQKIELTKLVCNLIEEKNIILTSKNYNEINFNIESFDCSNLEVIQSDFSRAISNLLNNSIDAIEREKGEINVTFTADLDYYQLTIQDNGKGISREVLSSIGEKGFSFGKENNIESGSGLGFFHAKKTMASINGIIDIETSLGTGTSIILKFPFNSKELSASSMILFEDDDLVKMSWEYYASKKSIAIYIFANYSEFLKIQESKPFNFHIPIYADINLKSSESGIEIVKKLNILGFLNINLTTGYDESTIDVPIFIKKIINKSFPFI